MKLRSGIHPERWPLGAWLLALALLLLALALAHRATGGDAAALAAPASAMEPRAGGGATETAPAPPHGTDAGVSSGTQAPEDDLLPPGEGARFVAEVIDSTFFVSPAQFLALDLPRDPAGARAIHLAGSIAVRGRNLDIVLRMFRAADYDVWLKQDGGRRVGPIWSSKKSRVHNLALDLPPGGPFVLLLDNGYSIRTPKYVSCQLQIQYGRLKNAGMEPAAATGAAAPTDSTAREDNPVTPRGNAEEEVPPPPPPPPPGGY
jgi:hypothetical protein